MDRKDFVEIKGEHFETCKQIMLQGGSCKNIACNICPFDIDNSTCDCCCGDTYGTDEILAGCQDPKLKESAEEFIKTFGGK